MPTTVTKSVKSSGGDYSSLSAWEAGQQGDLVTADEIRVAECYGFQDTTACTVAGSTTDATRYLRIVAAAGAEAQMPYNTDGTAYRLENTGVGALQCTDGTHLRVERIQLKNTHATVGRWGVYMGNNVQAIGLHVRSQASATLDYSGMTVWPGSGDANHVRNCVMTADGAHQGWDLRKGNAGTAYIYNCTAVGGGLYGFNRAGGTGILKNCLAAGGNHATGDVSTGWDAGSDYKAS